MSARVCKWCEAEILDGNANRIFCSNRCKKAEYNIRNRATINAAQRARNRTPRGREAQLRYRNKLKSERDLKRANKRRLDGELWAWSSLKPPRPCKWCGSPFAPLCDHAAYCSTHCKRLAHYKRRKTYRRLSDQKYRLTHRDLYLHRDRAHAAERALSTLLIPIRQPPEI